MEQTDFLLRQINKLTELLKKLLSDVLKLKDVGSFDRLTLIQTVLLEILHHDVDQIALLSNTELIELISDKKISPEGQKYLAEILNISAELSGSLNKQKLLIKSMIIYENILDKEKPDFSIELYSKIESLRRRLIILSFSNLMRKIYLINF